MPNTFLDANHYTWDFEKTSTEALFGLVKHLNPGLADYDQPSFGDIVRLSREQDAVQAKLTVRKPSVGTIKIKYLRFNVLDIARDANPTIKVTNEESAHELMPKLREALGLHVEARDLLDTPLPALERHKPQSFTLRFADNSLLYFGELPLTLVR